ncbi:hypothetical protein FQN54_005111 [Arachnomyces sp. PD_36]|nr:hypothetical protein FQN54_005111 [Arachnomyces sp. PD_36]
MSTDFTSSDSRGPHDAHTRSQGNGSKYNIALIGVGHRGYKTHFLSAFGSRSLNVVAVCDVNETALTNFSAKHPRVPTYVNLKDLLRNHRPDFAIICVPHRYHTEYVSLLSQAGVPILKEKPAADSIQQFCELESLPVKIGVTFQKRFEPRFVQFKRLLPSVGEVASFKATLALNLENLDTTWRAADGVGVTEDLGCHMLDLIAWFFGVPPSLMAQRVGSVRRMQKYGGDDVSDVTMRWGASNVIGHIHLSRVADKAEESITVVGTSGTLSLDGNRVTLREPSGAKSLEIVDSSNKQSVVQSMLQKFGDYVSGRSPNYPGALATFADTVMIMDATKKSFTSQQPERVLPLVAAATSKAGGAHHTWPLITPESVNSIVKQMHSSLSIYDRSNIYETFEDRWRKMHNLKHALVCSSGTIAIFHMFEALDLRVGDEILCPVYTFFATATPMLQFGAVPVFCDALPDGNIDPAEIIKKSNPKTRAVIVTHMWGLPCDMPKVMEGASRVNGGIKVLEDCSHAHGAVVAGKIVGSWGHMSAWSLQAKKNLTGGQAGVLATNSTDYYARAITHGHFNKRAKQEVPQGHPMRKFWLTGLGLNLRAHPLAIAMANQQLDCHPAWSYYREKFAQYMATKLSVIPFLKMPTVHNEDTDKHAWYAFVMQFDSKSAPKGSTRESFVEALTKRGLKEVDIPRSTGLLNELPLFTHSHEAIPRYGPKPWHAPQPNSDFPTAKQFYDSAVKLPMWATAGDESMVQHYAETFVDVAETLLGRKLKGQKQTTRAQHQHKNMQPEVVARANL